MYRIYIFLDSSIPAHNQFNTVVQEVWNGIQHPQSAEGVWIMDRAQNRAEDFARQLDQFQIGVLPSVAFVEISGAPDQGRVLVRIIGQASRSRVEQVYLDLLEGKYQGSGSSASGSSPIIEGEGQTGILPGLFTGRGSTIAAAIAIFLLITRLTND